MRFESLIRGQWERAIETFQVPHEFRREIISLGCFVFVAIDAAQPRFTVRLERRRETVGEVGASLSRRKEEALCAAGEQERQERLARDGKTGFWRTAFLDGGTWMISPA